MFCSVKVRVGVFSSILVANREAAPGICAAITDFPFESLMNSFNTGALTVLDTILQETQSPGTRSAPWSAQSLTMPDSIKSLASSAAAAEDSSESSQLTESLERALALDLALPLLRSLDLSLDLLLRLLELDLLCSCSWSPQICSWNQMLPENQLRKEIWT